MKMRKEAQGDKAMSTEFASAGFTAGQLNAIVKKLGGEESGRQFLRGGLTVSYQKLAQFVGLDGKVTLENFMKCVTSWREQDGVICFSVTSDGTTGPQWVERLKKKGFQLSKWAKDVLNSKDFQPTNGVTTEIAVLKGMLFEDDDRITKKIRAEANRRKFTKPNAEVACLIREMFTDEEIEAMGLVWITTMHEPIKDSDDDPHLLIVYRDVSGRWLYAYYDEPDYLWNRDFGFAFVVPQVSPQD
ncbi:MAG: hypothetical protein A2750_00890 [Candidatus Yanofskybacteria bacterium RIFCSPHIGHO2_01_FULL_45_42]|nr:MAG: hypothetical protein A2750_00890 [Candidatus Yanofskybacteria bacterium RIFCSPHIGHO2_01_FULL_45_42]OGN27010.1 MAG: hypothetical protein A3B17_03235 [Candidatus Yanofskybacteria bacterium RIFCSPLOWO2_01_FULL_45_72]OGN32420.1 MAG: hypothetical protein A3J01_00685 [Candidatus Yanofskybacteria bacterium RIFCSPLOWO2_02_FULL_45_18]